MAQPTIRLLLVPLDERPVNTRYPQAVAAMAGAELLLPPAEIRGWKRTAANLDSLARWLSDTAPSCSAALISCDYLGYGNLINARITDESAVDILSRLAIITRLKIPIHAFSLITRVSNADDNVEEPLYWKDWGTKFYRLSQLQHRETAGDTLSDVDTETISRLKDSIPADLTADWLRRRLRNHTVNLALIDLAARGQIESLLLTSDDTAKWGFPSRERKWLKSWTDLIPHLSSNVEMHPGADEVGTALVSRLIHQQRGSKPSVYVDYAIDADKVLIAPYEDRPICETVAGQVQACGGQITTNPAEADLVLGVLTPSPNRKDYQPQFLDSDRQVRTGPYTDLFARLTANQATSTAVVLADVAYPNGADPLAIELLLSEASPLNLGQLAGYGAWNTAGNTLGVAIAEGLISRLVGSEPDRITGQKIFLAHRFLEDWGYQTVVRREARAFAQSLWDRQEPNPESLEEIAQVSAFIEDRLNTVLAQLQDCGVGTGLSIKHGSTRLPWNRTFEVDFDLIETN